MVEVAGCAAGPSGRVDGERGNTTRTESSVTPFLMFQDGRAEEAMRFYVATFGDGRIVRIERYGAGEQGPAGSVRLGEFEVKGQRVRCTDSPIEHGFDFTPSVSLFVDCATEEEMERLAGALAADGSFLMPPDDYGFSKRFAWVVDRYGVSWQVNLPGE